MAETKKTTKKVSAKKSVASKKVVKATKSTTGVKKSGSFFNKLKLNTKQGLSLSVLVNVLLVILVLTLASNPTSYSDASTGYTVKIPNGWVRDDIDGMFRASSTSEAEILVFGQRNATAGFYDLEQEERDSTMEQVIAQIQSGNNQFIPGTIGLTDYQNEAKREVVDGVETIRTSFTALHGGDHGVTGEHLLYISKGGGFYSVVVFADTAEWSAVSKEAVASLNTFKAE